MLKRGQKGWQQVSCQRAACWASFSSAGSVWPTRLSVELRQETNPTSGLTTALLVHFVEAVTWQWKRVCSGKVKVLKNCCLWGNFRAWLWKCTGRQELCLLCMPTLKKCHLGYCRITFLKGNLSQLKNWWLSRKIRFWVPLVFAKSKLLGFQREHFSTKKLPKPKQCHQEHLGQS